MKIFNIKEREVSVVKFAGFSTVTALTVDLFFTYNKIYREKVTTTFFTNLVDSDKEQGRYIKTPPEVARAGLQTAG